jgi:ATP-binding cassette subfamily B protein
VFDRGQVVESGTHAELLARNGHYASLWQKQQGFEVSDDGASATIKPERLARIPLLSALSQTSNRSSESGWIKTFNSSKG